MALEDVIIFIVSALLLAVALYVGDKVFGNRKIEFNKGYYVTALLTAVVILLLIVGVSAIVSVIDFLGIGQIIPILTFVVSVYIIKMMLMKAATYERSTWVGVIAWLLVYIMNFISTFLFSIVLIRGI